MTRYILLAPETYAKQHQELVEAVKAIQAPEPSSMLPMIVAGLITCAMLCWLSYQRGLIAGERKAFCARCRREFVEKHGREQIG